jgi:DNA-binding MarR family transcriptional regulator
MTVTQPEHPHPSLTPLQMALKRAQARNRELENYITWEERLFANAHLSATHKLTLIATRHAVLRGQTHDEAGRTRLNLNTIAERIGVSPDTVGRNLKYLENVGVVDRQTRPEVQENGERWTRVYASLNEELLKAPEKIVPEAPRNHGGTRYRCQHCGSEQVTIKRRVTLVCKCCQHESLLEESERDQEPTPTQSPVLEEETVPTDDLKDNKKPVSPPVSDDASDITTTSIPADESATQDTSSAIDEAASLLIALAGPSDEHIEMSRGGTKKYYTVHRKLTIDDLRDHLQGGKTCGALCLYPGGQTRGLCWDTDTPEQWSMVVDAAGQLAHIGYMPILEPSPANRGGHLWIIFDALVDASAAQRAIYERIPALETLAEYWPGPQNAKHWNNVRLPGGRYVRPSINAWCQLISVSDGETSRNGDGAARLLLAHQTPASIVPPPGSDTIPVSDDPAVPECQDKPISDENTNASVQGLDSRWHTQYGQTEEGKHLWFAFTPSYVAAWYNAHHDVRDLLPPDKDGYGLAHWRDERTASVAFRGDHWTDFGASARRNDGTQDSGDALELQVRVCQEPKPEVLRQAAKELVQEARAVLECAARKGEPIPAWLEEIITDAGRAHYEQVQNDKQQGVPIFTKELADLSSASDGMARKQPIDHENRQFTDTVGFITSSQPKNEDTVEKVARELAQWIIYTPADPCKSCGCTLTYDLQGYSACARCYPSSRRWGDENQERIQRLFPVRKGK